MAPAIMAMSQELLWQVSAAIGPWLALVWILRRVAAQVRPQLREWAQLTLTGTVAAGILLVHVEGLAISRWLAELTTSFSIPFIAMLAVAIYERALGRQVFSERDWAAGWSFGAIGSLALYPLALGVGTLDPYEWGWRFSPLFVAIAALSSWLIWKKNRFGLLLLAAAIAFQLHLLESGNYWDYLLDPIYGLVSIAALTRRGLSALSRPRLQPELL
jgi:hypothetical protein